jgi:hypothetical protein
MAVVVSKYFTLAGERYGFFWSINATAPEVIGVAIEVPLNDE